MILLVPYTKICYSGHNMILLVPYTKICYSGHYITYTSTPLPLISGTLTSAPLTSGTLTSAPLPPHFRPLPPMTSFPLLVVYCLPTLTVSLHATKSHSFPYFSLSLPSESIINLFNLQSRY